MPDISLQLCWWVVNVDQPTDGPAKLLVKSLAVLRAELHRLRAATMSSVRAELDRRSVHNSQVRALLDKNPQWR